MSTELPRVVIAAPGSGHGKTTVAIGLMAALRRAGHQVSGHKIGPDYIDPGYHALATGRPGRNLDAHLVGTDLLVPLLLHGANTPRPADIAVVEGVMGLHDGAIGREGFASTAHVASIISAPVVLVVDASAASRTVAAVVHGLASFDTSVRVAGVVLNKVGSDRHAGEIISALEATGVTVLGALRRNDDIAAPSRHLGLVPAEERPEAVAALDRLADQIATGVDLAELMRIARGAPPLTGEPWDPAQVVHGDQGFSRPVVAVAGGRAFTFRYAETDELLRAAGLQPVVFDPTRDVALPPQTAAIYLGGGFPEVHAADLAANEALREQLRAAIGAGVPTVAECAGLLYLCRSVDGAPMVGALDATAVMTPKLTLGYRTAVAPTATLLGPAGTRAAGHEFHRTMADPPHGGQAGWLLDGRPDGFSLDPAGVGRPTVHASYLHTHWAGQPLMAGSFAAAARAARPWTNPTGVVRPVRRASHRVNGATTVVDLHHHGDSDTAAGLMDLAVNVQPGPPAWLADRLREAMSGLSGYPDPAAATAAIAARHGRAQSDVLPTSGGAEVFTLLARALRPRHAVVVHPQFTEPEAALRAAGHPVHRVVLRAEDDFALHPWLIPESADLVVIGNPTNPTGALHPADLLRSLVRPGRVLLIDEAFMDTVPGELESLAGEAIPGLLVARSLTKTWGLAGLRAGYAVGDSDLVARMAVHQPPWSVSSPALVAMVQTATDSAVAEAVRHAQLLPARRDLLAAGLAARGLSVVPSRAPFVLVDSRPVLPPGAAVGWLRLALRQHGFAVRRGETFPGLDADWLRIAVRDEPTTRALLAAIGQILAQAAEPAETPIGALR